MKQMEDRIKITGHSFIASQKSKKKAQSREWKFHHTYTNCESTLWEHLGSLANEGFHNSYQVSHATYQEEDAGVRQRWK